MRSVSAYFKDSIGELRQVRWPTRQQAVRLSIVVIAFTAACAAVFGFVDYILSNAVRFLLSTI